MSTFVFKNLRWLFDKYAVVRTKHDPLVKSIKKISSNFVAFSEKPKLYLIFLFEFVFVIWVRMFVSTSINYLNLEFLFEFCSSNDNVADTIIFVMKMIWIWIWIWIWICYLNFALVMTTLRPLISSWWRWFGFGFDFGFEFVIWICYLNFALVMTTLRPLISSWWRWSPRAIIPSNCSWIQWVENISEGLKCLLLKELLLHSKC